MDLLVIYKTYLPVYVIYIVFFLADGRTDGRVWDST